MNQPPQTGKRIVSKGESRASEDFPQRFRKPIMTTVFVVGLGAVLYMNMLARSMRGDYAQMQHLDQDVIHAPEREPFNQKIETERAILSAIRADDPQRLAASFPQGIQKETRVAQARRAIYAVDLGAQKVLAYLLELGTDVNMRGSDGKTLLMAASDTAQPALVKTLLVHGASVNTADKDGRTALMMVGNLATIPPSSMVNTTPGARNHMYNYSRTSVPLSVQEKEAALRLLLEHGADVNAADKWGYTPLIEAASHNNLEHVRLLLARGAKINTVTHYGRSALTGAVMLGENVALVQLLLDKGANVNQVEKDYGTPLHIARKHNKHTLIPILLQAGAKDEGA
jgi:hypothetical protein